MTPLVVIAAGLPGAGKTSLLTWIAGRTDAVLVSRDELRRVLFPRCEYTDLEKATAYESMKVGIAVNLEMGRSAFPDGICFTRRREIDEIQEIGRTGGAFTLTVSCVCPPEVAKARVERDRVTLEWVPEDRTADLVDAVGTRFEPLPPDALAVDMSLTVEDAGRSVLAHLRELGWEPST